MLVIMGDQDGDPAAAGRNYLRSLNVLNSLLDEADKLPLHGVGDVTPDQWKALREKLSKMFIGGLWVHFKSSIFLLPS